MRLDEYKREHHMGRTHEPDGTRAETKNEPTLQLPKNRELLERMQRYDEKGQTFGGVRLTSPEKVLYPEDGITKLELAAYYQLVAKWMLPHLKDRPIVLVRCPDGKHEKCFYQKHPVVGTPKELRCIPVTKDGKSETFVVADNDKALVSLSQISALEIHAWGSRADRLANPDRLVFDLDPDSTITWSTVKESAVQVRDLLQVLGLKSFVKTTGGKGLHIVVPIARQHEWEQARGFCREVAELIVRYAPQQYTATMAKTARAGKIYLDYLRNAWEATAIAPYSTRARPGATVSVPLKWEELDEIPSPNHFTIRNIADRLKCLKRDPWQAMKSVRQNLTQPLKTLKLLSKKE